MQYCSMRTFIAACSLAACMCAEKVPGYPLRLSNGFSSRPDASALLLSRGRCTGHSEIFFVIVIVCTACSSQNKSNFWAVLCCDNRMTVRGRSCQCCRKADTPAIKVFSFSRADS